MGRRKQQVLAGILNERELVVASTMVVQAAGIATPEEVNEILAQNGMATDRDALVYALERMRSRQILSETGKQVDGHREKAYKMRRVIWAAIPELAQIKPMLPKLVESEEATALLETLGDQESEGGKKGRKPEVTDYHAVRLDLEALLPICGGVPKDADHNIFSRSNGFLHLKPLGFQNAIAKLMRLAGLTESKAMYVYPVGIFVRPKLALTSVLRSIHDQRTGQGLGLKHFEAIAAGERFPIWLHYPEKGIMPLEQFVRLWNGNHVHLGSYYVDMGATRVVKCEDLGPAADVETAKQLEAQQAAYFEA